MVSLRYRIDAVLLVGARDLDPGEQTALSRSQIVRLSASASTSEIEPVLQSTLANVKNFYVHLDLDALDPTEGKANGSLPAADSRTRV